MSPSILTLERLAETILTVPEFRAAAERELVADGLRIDDMEAEVPKLLALIREQPGAEATILAVAQAVYWLDRPPPGSMWRAVVDRNPVPVRPVVECGSHWRDCVSPASRDKCATCPHWSKVPPA